MFTTGQTTSKRKKKLVESEKSPTVLALLWQHDLSLKRQSMMLANTHRSLTYRLTTGQKMVYKTFQKNMHQHDIAYARLMGEKDLEQELRKKSSSGYRSNTNFSEDYDDDGLLKRIWYAGNSAREAYRKDKPNEFSADQMRPSTAVLHTTTMYLGREPKPKTKRSRSSLSLLAPSRSNSRTQLNTPSGNKKLLDKRPATSFELSRNEDVVLAMGEQQAKGDSPSVEVPRLTEQNSYIETGGRPKTAYVNGPEAPNERRQGTNEPRPTTVDSTGFYDVTTRSPTALGGVESSASKHIYQGPEHARRPKLVDLYKNHVSQQGYGDRISTFVNKVQEFRDDRDRMLKDYYAVKLVSDSDRAQGENYVAHRRDSCVDEAEYRQCVGNPNVRSHTFKSVKLKGTPLSTGMTPRVAAAGAGLSRMNSAIGSRTVISCE